MFLFNLSSVILPYLLHKPKVKLQYDDTRSVDLSHDSHTTKEQNKCKKSKTESNHPPLMNCCGFNVGDYPSQ